MNRGPSQTPNQSGYLPHYAHPELLKTEKRRLSQLVEENKGKLASLQRGDPEYNVVNSNIIFYQSTLKLIEQWESTKDCHIEELLQNVWQKFGSPLIEGSVTSFSLLNTIYTIAVGGPAERIQPTMQATARSLPVFATITAIENLLESYESEHFVMARRLWKSTSAAIKNSPFLLAFFFYVLSDIIQAVKHEPATTQVNISNYAAAAVIATCFALSSLGGLRIYFIEEDIYHKRIGYMAPYPSKIKRFLHYISCNSFTSRFMGFITGAAAMHWLISSLEKVIGNMNTTMGRIIRYLLTGLGGLPTILLGYAPGFQRPFIFQTQIYISLLLTQFAALALNAYQMFSNAAAKSFFGASTLKEQFYFWAIAFPLFVATIPLSILAWKKLPRQKEEEASLFSPSPAQDMEAPSLSDAVPAILPAYSAFPSADINSLPETTRRQPQTYQPLRI